MDPFAIALPAAPPDPFANIPPGGYPGTELFGAQPIITIGPKLPDDYVPDPRPKREMVLKDAEMLLGDHAQRLREARIVDTWLSGSRHALDVGHFETDADDIVSGEIEVMPLITLRADEDFNTGIMAGMDFYVEHLSRDRIDAEEVLAIEDACYYLMECKARQYAKQYGGVLKRVYPWQMQRRGALVTLVTVDPRDAACGLRMTQIDPLTVFPVWEGANGLAEVFRVYEDTAGNIIGNFGDPAGSVRRKVRAIAKTSGDSGGPDRNRMLEVKEYWNRDWVQVLVDDKEVLTRRHGYARVPFIITLGAFELPMGVSTGNVLIYDNASPEPGYHRTANGERDIAAHWRPWAWRQIPGHAVQEAVAGRSLTQFKNSLHPPMIYEQDFMTRNQDTVELSSHGKTVNRIPLGNKLSILPTSPDGPTAAMLGAFLQTNAEQGPWSQLRAGNVPPQTSDSALGTMFDLGGADRAAITDAIALHVQAELEWCLELLRDYGPILGSPGSRGVMPIPVRSDYGYGTPVHLLTPEMIERAGTYLRVTMFTFQPKPGPAQYISTLRNAGLISQETAMRKLRHVPDPLREIQRIEDDLLRQTPEIATQFKLKQLQDQIDRAIEEGDYESADYAMVAAMQLEWNAEMQMLQGMAPPKGGGAAPPGMGMGQPGALDFGQEPQMKTPAAINQQGLSLPQVGIGTGQQGGRPIQPIQPREATRPNLVTAPVR